MNLAHRLELWGDRHHPRWLDIVRILLGVFMVYKGFDLLQNMNVLIDALNNRLSFSAFALSMFGHYVVFAHFGGGVLLALGLLTRVACLIQIPVLLGAVFLINSSGDIFRPFSELALSVVVLLLLFLFLIVGSGPWSLDAFIERENAQEQ